jgi:hypothetical protein
MSTVASSDRSVRSAEDAEDGTVEADVLARACTDDVDSWVLIET